VDRGPADRLCLLSSAVHDEPAGTIAERAASAGFQRIEWGVGPDQAAAAAPGEAAALRALSDEHGLTITGVCVQGGPATLDDPESIRLVVAFAAELGAPFIRFWPPGSHGGPIADELARARSGIAAALAIARAAGVRLLLENAPATLAPSTTLARSLVEGLDPADAGVLWDPANGLIEGRLDAQLAISELGPYLHHVHAKNIVWTRPDGAWTWGYSTIADGMLDWPATLGALAAAGYDGPISLDHLSSEQTVEGMRHDADELRALLRDAEAQRP
jgi:sugar phosphate isomerase/epimerase